MRRQCCLYPNTEGCKQRARVFKPFAISPELNLNFQQHSNRGLGGARGEVAEVGQGSGATRGRGEDRNIIKIVNIWQLLNFVISNMVFLRSYHFHSVLKDHLRKKALKCKSKQFLQLPAPVGYVQFDSVGNHMED